ncbi:ABC transporter substrate-binding protein [Rhizobium rhizogenes]|uniref:ABC transporter substrate-binding protein n=1 Tax=Rhizobium rhizogenes TaxID=359 RepID=UPI00157185B1|nr:ABC transporter substrate-binding protein [Rhizobium rhizogenes]NTI78476.1 ABC transporter substrate-binding protein [Rhizobium rhizogenes]
MGIHSGWLRLAGGVAVMAAVLSAAPVQAAETLRVGKAAPSFALSLVEAGTDFGTFGKDLQLEVSTFGGGPKLQQALAAGSVDIGFSSGPDMALIAKGAPVKAVAVILNGVDQVVVTNPEAGYKSFDDLKGKTFAASSPAALSGWLPRKVAEAKGWGADGVKLQTVSSQSSAVALLETKQVDGLTLDPASAIQGEKSGKMKITYRYADLFPKFPQYVIYATDDVIAKKPEMLKAFLKGYLATVTYARSHKDETVTSMSRIIGVDKDIVGPVYDDAMKLYSATGKFEPDAMTILLDSFVANGVLDKKPEQSALINASFLP